MPTDDTMTIHLIDHGTSTIHGVDRKAFQKALDEEELNDFLDSWASNIDSGYVVVLDDGTLIDPFNGKSRPSLRHSNKIPDALTSIIRSADRDVDQETAKRIAAAVVAAFQQEGLVIMLAEEADGILRAGVNRALLEVADQLEADDRGNPEVSAAWAATRLRRLAEQNPST